MLRNHFRFTLGIEDFPGKPYRRPLQRLYARHGVGGKFRSGCLKPVVTLGVCRT